MRKKWLSIILALACIISCVTLVDSRVSADIYDDYWDYDDDDDDYYPWTDYNKTYDYTCEYQREWSYTGSAVTPAVDVKYNGASLVKDVDYTVTYTNNVNYGVGTITITGIGSYSGSKEFKFGIVPEKVTGLKIASPKKLEAKITWSKCKGAMGFVIERSEDNYTWTKVCTMKDGNWQVYQDSSALLKDNKTYYYRITPFVYDPSANDYWWDDDSSDYFYGKSNVIFGKVTSAFKESKTPIYTGCADVDYAAYCIVKGATKSSWSQEKKIKALYNWVVDKCTHTHDDADITSVKWNYSKNSQKALSYSKKIWKDIYTGKADINFDGYYYEGNYDKYQVHDSTSRYSSSMTVDGYSKFERTYLAFQSHKGGCSYITRLFKVLVNQIGCECTLVDGNYVNRNGSKMYHYWCYIRLNKKYGWYDVDVATSNKKVRWNWYNKNAKFWHTCHEWNNDYVPMGVPKSLR